MKTTAVNAPMQLRQEMHIGSFMDVVLLDLIKRFNPDTEIVIGWNALGKFRQKDGTNNAEAFNLLFDRAKALVDGYCQPNNYIHFLDDDPEIYNYILEIVSKMSSEKTVKIKEYNAWYCETCNSYLGPAEQPLKLCKKCSTSLTQKMATDLFIKIDKKSIRTLTENLVFIPEKMKNKFFGVFSDMPDEFIITKERTDGFSAEPINGLLKGKVFDPKFVYSLFPTLAVKLGLPPIKTVILGQDILGRYLYYFLANNQSILDPEINVIVHGMLTRAGKKISKYGNFPEITDINKFLEKYSWEHLKLLYLSANIGQAIDFDQKIIEVAKLVIKKKNVLLFLEQTDAQKKLPADEWSETEMEIVKSCQKLIRKLSQLELFEFYSSYHDLWFDLLSRRYISELRNNQGSQSGLKKIRELLPTIL